MKRRWPLGVLGALGIVLAAALAVTLISARTLKGSVPGRSPVLALATTPSGFLAGGEAGLFSSRDGKQWRRILATPTSSVLVEEKSPGRIFIATSGGILVSEDQGRRWTFTGMRAAVTALAQRDGKFFAVGKDRLLYDSSDGQTWQSVIPAVRP